MAESAPLTGATDAEPVVTRDYQVVVLRLANEHYGVDIARVQEIIRVQPITRVPHAPASVEGVLNLRGRVIPIIDLRARFGFPRNEASSETRIAIIDVVGTTVGVVVDGVSEVLTIPSSAVEPPSPVAVGKDAAFIAGVAKLDARLVLLIDANAILSDLDQVFAAEQHAALVA